MWVVPLCSHLQPGQIQPPPLPNREDSTVSELCGKNQNAKPAKVIWGKEKRKSFPESLLEGCLPCSAAVMSQLVLLSEITDINCCGQATQLDFSQMAQMKVSITLI